MVRRWTLYPQQTDRAQAMAVELNVPAAVCQLLLNRGVASIDEGRKFLERRLTYLHDPEGHPGIEKAADLIHAAVQAGERICIYGDYDVDGMCATAILWECLRLAGAAPRFYVPDRLEEGYGVNAAALEHLRNDEGVDLVVTVDCGITSIAEAVRARELGLQYIVTDHHDMREELPAADAVVHPRLPGSTYPFGQLCGTGVAYKLAWEIARRFSGGRRTTDAFRRFLLDATTLAAVGTICDVVPLADENRILVHQGLLSLRAEPPLGLRCLIRYAGLHEKPQLTTGDVGFTLGPRLNACGRLGTARLGVELLTTRDETRAIKLAEYLEEQNKQRQLLERRMFLHARELAEKQYGAGLAGDTAAIILAEEYAPDKWHPGVLGIVAGRMAERFHRPCVLIAMRDDVGSGSGRSIAGFHLHDALKACRENLLSVGGHAMAVGVRVLRERFEAFRSNVEERTGETLTPADKVNELRLDAEVSLDLMNVHLVRSLDVLEPFGFANAAPVFLATNLEIVAAPRKVGAGERHLSFQLRQGAKGTPRRAIGFEMADRLEELTSAGGKCCLAFTPLLNTFRNFTSVDLRVKDLRAGAFLAD